MMKSRSVIGAVFVTALIVLPTVPDSSAATGLTPACRVLASGRNNNGQLGDGTTVDRTSPVPFLLPTSESARSVEIASGGTAPGVNVLTYSGKVYSAGLNNHGQLGDGTTGDRSTPVGFVLPPGERAAAVVGAGNTTYVMTRTGRVFGAGRNHKGQLGDGTLTSRAVPVELPLPAGQLAAKVFPGLESVYVVSTTGVLYAVGGNYFGQFGQGNQIDATAPVVFPLPAGETAVDVVEGSDALFVMTVSGQVFGAGTNAFGQLGNGTTNNSTVPVQYVLPAGETAVQVYPGVGSTFVRTASGTVFGSGYNMRGQLGDGTMLPQATPVQFVLPAGEIAGSLHVGPDRVYVLTASGRIFGAGANETGQLGIGSLADAPTPAAMLLPAGEAAVEVDPTLDAVFVRVASGAVYSMGANGFGYLGDGTYATRTLPVRWGLPSAEKAIEVSPALGYVFVTTSAGNTYGAGWNLAGNLGDGTSINQPSPVIRVNPPGTRIVSTRSILSKHSFSYGISCTRSGTLSVTTKTTGGPPPDVWTLTVDSPNCAVLPLTGTVPGTDGTIRFESLPVYQPGGAVKCIYVVSLQAVAGFVTTCLEPSYTLLDALETEALVCNTGTAPPPTIATTVVPPSTTGNGGVLPSNPSTPATVTLPETGSNSSGPSALIALTFIGLGVIAVIAARRRSAVVRVDLRR